MSATGFVLIGRDEGERLRRCLASVVRTNCPVVYVDSGSRDGSVAAAQAAGALVVALDMSRPFTAARARNAGWRRLLQAHPDLQQVHFLDGDCELVDGWLPLADQALAPREQDHHEADHHAGKGEREGQHRHQHRAAREAVAREEHAGNEIGRAHV